MLHINDLTVKILLKDNDGTLHNCGSGIMIVHDGVYFVLTAYHCLNEVDEDEKVHPRPDEWRIELFTENGKELKQKDVREDPDEDIAAIIVDKPDNHIDENMVQLFTNTVSKEQYFFRGFPQVTNFEPHTFKVTYIDDDYWTFVNKEIDSGRKAGVELLEGSSGSGVVFSRREKMFVVGIVRALHDYYGSLNEFKVIPIEKFREFLPEEAFSSFSANMLEDWQKGLDNDNTAKQIEELKKQNARGTGQ